MQIKIKKIIKKKKNRIRTVYILKLLHTGCSTKETIPLSLGPKCMYKSQFFMKCYVICEIEIAWKSSEIASFAEHLVHSTFKM